MGPNNSFELKIPISNKLLTGLEIKKYMSFHTDVHLSRMKLGFLPFVDPGPQEEDELYEMYMAETNKVYIVQGDTLVPHEQFWGATPKYEMLESDKVGVYKYLVLQIVGIYHAHISVFQCNVHLIITYQ